MARVSKEQRKEARRKRMRQGNQARQGGRIVPDCIDLSVFAKKLKMYEIRKRDNEIDILGFIVTQDWYPDLRDLKPYEIGPKIGIKPGEDDYKLQYAFHPKLGAEKRDYLCLRHMFGKPCPACEELDPIWEKKKEDRTKEDLAKANALKHKWRCLYEIYDYNDPDVNLKLWDFSYYLFEESLQDKIEDENGGIHDISDPEDGETITFDGKEKSLGDNSFIEAEGIRFKKREPYNDSIYDETLPLDQALVIPTYDEIARALLHMDTADDNDSNSEEERSSSRGRGRNRSADDSKQKTERGRRGIGRRRQADDDQNEEESPLPEEESFPPEEDRQAGECPEGLNFGVDCNTDNKCQECPQEDYDRCATRFEEIEKEKKAAEAKGTEGGGSRRRPRRK